MNNKKNFNFSSKEMIPFDLFYIFASTRKNAFFLFRNVSFLFHETRRAPVLVASKYIILILSASLEYIIVNHTSSLSLLLSV